jgi:hypothetical protein
MGSVLPDGGSADGAVLTNTKIRRAKKPTMKSSFQMEISSRVIIIFIFLPPLGDDHRSCPEKSLSPDWGNDGQERKRLQRTKNPWSLQRGTFWQFHFMILSRRLGVMLFVSQDYRWGLQLQ